MMRGSFPASYPMSPSTNLPESETVLGKIQLIIVGKLTSRNPESKTDLVVPRSGHMTGKISSHVDFTLGFIKSVIYV